MKKMQDITVVREMKSMQAGGQKKQNGERGQQVRWWGIGSAVGSFQERRSCLESHEKASREGIQPLISTEDKENMK